MARTLDELLQSMPALRGLRPKERELLSMVMKEERYRPGDAIVHEGEPGHSCYFIIDGEVEVLKAIGRGQERVITTLRRDGLFGQIALVDAGKRAATCRARTHVHVARLDRQDFDTLFSSGSHFAFQFQNVIARADAQQLRQANSRLNLLLSRRKQVEADSARDAALRDVQDMLAMSDTDDSIKWLG